MLRDIKISTRVAAGFATVAALIALLGGVVLFEITRLHQNSTTIYADQVLPLQQLKLVADAYAVSIVDNAHKVRAGSVSFADGRQTIARAVGPG
jgi:CHASE3 domain sensor protein